MAIRSGMRARLSVFLAKRQFKFRLRATFRYWAIVRVQAIIFKSANLSRTREARRLRRSSEGRSLTSSQT
jgi:hypothetical protein